MNEKQIKQIADMFSKALPTTAAEVNQDYAKVVVKNKDRIISILQSGESSESMKEEILRKSFGITEMAKADLEGVDLDQSPKEIASAYIRNAKERGLADKQIISGLGATFRKMEMPDDKIAKVKEAIKSELGFKPRKKESSTVKKPSITKKAKEDETYQGTEKVRAAAKKASEVMGESTKHRILDLVQKPTDEQLRMEEAKKNSMLDAGKGKKAYSKDTDVYLTKKTDDKQYLCKYCGDKFYSKEALDKHQRTCG